MPPAGYRASSETVIKRSRFITTLARTDSEAAARALVAEVRAAHPDARHHCLAFVIDDDGQRLARSSDDGEPAGTAGVPMLNALTQAGLADITAVVTRYFGGVKLGASGLARAYGGCVASGVAAMPRVVRQIRPVWALRLSQAEAGRVQEDLLRAGATLVETRYDTATVRLRLTFPGDPASLVARITQGKVSPVADGEEVVELPAEEAAPPTAGD